MHLPETLGLRWSFPVDDGGKAEAMEVDYCPPLLLGDGHREMPTAFPAGDAAPVSDSPPRHGFGLELPRVDG